MKSDEALSIVIPCKDEENYLPCCLAALEHEQSAFGFVSEVIVVDNGSRDKSVAIAEQFGVKVYSVSGTIAHARNYGANLASSEFICFVDADVEVERGWSKSVADHIRSNNSYSRGRVFGNIYGISKCSSWVERAWIANLSGRKQIRYINGGNMIVHRILFDKLGGFDANRITGEDVDFCKRAVIAGADVVIDSDIVCIHHGYPKGIVDFFQRERWHGIGSVADLKQGAFTKAAVLALAGVLVPVSLLLLSFYAGLSTAIVVILGLYIFLLLMCGLRVGPIISASSFQLSVLFLVYTVARGQSLIDVVFLGNCCSGGSGRMK